jgi:hypothetical protein
MSDRRPPRIALATYPGNPELTPDDALLIPELKRLGAETTVVPWSDPAMDWSHCSAVVVRSTWDYHLDPGRFLGWTLGLERLRVPAINPAPLLRWNVRKDYLRVLEQAGVGVVPTRWIAPHERRTLRSVLESAGWDQAVVKPVVSASAHETWRTDLGSSEADEARFSRLVAGGDVMVQPFLDEIETTGEWSLVFLGHRFSHAVVKRPRAGDFRVQHQFGGSRELVRPDDLLLTAARQILAHAPGPSVYARIDGCVIDGRFLLMELELIEPELFLGMAEGAAGRFAEAIMTSVTGGAD